MAKNKALTFHEFNTLIDVCYNREQLAEQVKKAPKPEKVGEVALPEDLSELTFGQIIMLLSSGEEETFVQMACDVFKIDNINDARAEEAWGFLMWLQHSLLAIAERFNKCHIEPTAEEMQAGANRVSFGWFGLIDWFALRMRISHEQAENTCWMNVLRSLEIDTEKQRYERRFRQLQERKLKAKKR